MKESLNDYCPLGRNDWHDLKSVLNEQTENFKMLHANVGNISKDLIESRAAIASTVGNAIRMSVILVLSVEALFGVVILILVLKDDFRSFKAGTSGLEITSDRK